MPINPLSSTQQTVSTLADKKPAVGVNNNNNRPFSFLWSLKNNTELENIEADKDVINANAGNEDALKGEELKIIPKDILLKALKEARIEQSEHNINVVKALVKENLPLTPKNISTLVAQSSIFKDVPLETLAMMMRLQIPMTEENVKQFDNLIRTGENITDKINSLIERIPLEILSNSKNLSEISFLFAKFAAFSKLANIQGSETGGKTLKNNNDSKDNTASLNKLMEAISNRNEALIYGGKTKTAQSQQAALSNLKPLLSNAELRELINALRAIKAPSALINRIISINAETMRNAEMPQNTATAAATAKSSVQIAAEEIINILDRFIQEINVRTQSETVRKPVNTNENAKNTNMRSGSQRFTVEDVGGRKELFENVQNLLTNKSFNKIIKTSIEEKWLLKPYNININQVEEFLSKLNENLNRFSQQLREANLPNLRAEAKDIQDAAKLINDLNKSMPFLQIPIKLSGEVINSELYVLTKIKKDGKGTGGGASSENLNILLKLELNNLGSLDIYMNMTGKNIRSKFFTPKDETLNILREYLPELNSSITKLGFTFRSSVSKTDKGFDFVEDFLNRELPRTEFRRHALHINI